MIPIGFVVFAHEKTTHLCVFSVEKIAVSC